MKYKLIVQLTFILMLSALSGLPTVAQTFQCSQNCQLNVPNQQDIHDAINDLVDSSLLPVSVQTNEETGVTIVTLNDGSMFSLSTIGLSLKHQNRQQRRVNQSEDGSLHVRTEAGLEIRLRAAIHQEPEAVTQMFQSGWSDFFWFDNGIEATSPAGERMCLAPDMAISQGSIPQEVSISYDSEGYVVVISADGVSQRLHACAHDFLQLRDHIRLATQEQLVFNTDGTFALDIDGELTRFRLNARLLQTGVLDNPGFFVDGERITFRYRDGWEQEIITLL